MRMNIQLNGEPRTLPAGDATLTPCSKPRPGRPPRGRGQWRDRAARPHGEHVLPKATASRSCTRSAAAESSRIRCADTVPRHLGDNRAMNTLPRFAGDRRPPIGSRLLTGTGKFKDLDETRPRHRGGRRADRHRRHPPHQHRPGPGEPNLLDVLPPERYTILPNTAGCYTAEDAVRTCRLARELLDGHKLVKLEVLGDQKTLYPDVMQTLKAAEQLVADGFEVMVYTSDDPILAKRLERSAASR
jgi:hypothetical protein